MSATDELRRLLDDRGAEWDGESYEGVTFWNDDTNLAVASEGKDEKLWVSQYLTPEQAIAATLGDNECDQLKAENTKLRELVRAAWRCIHTGASCSDCRLIAGGCTLQSAMRELGIEVG